MLHYILGLAKSRHFRSISQAMGLCASHIRNLPILCYNLALIIC